MSETSDRVTYLNVSDIASAMDVEVTVIELAKNAILAGYVPDKWIGLLITLREKRPDMNELGSGACKAVFELIPIYGSSALLPYLRAALTREIVNLPTLTTNLLNHYGEPNSSDLGPMGVLFQLILDVHFASQQDFIVTPPEIPNLLSLLKGLYSLTPPPYEGVIQTISQVAVLILSGIRELPAMPAPLAATSLGLCNELIRIFRAPTELKTALESLSFALESLHGDRFRTDLLPDHVAPSSTDGKQRNTTVSRTFRSTELALHISHIVRLRGTTVGCGSDNALSSLIAFFRASAGTFIDTFSQLLTASLECLAATESTALNNRFLFRNFVLGRLPPMIKSIETEPTLDISSGNEPGVLVHAALMNIYHNKESLLTRCDLVCDGLFTGTGRDEQLPFRTQFIFSLVHSSVLTQTQMQTLTKYFHTMPASLLLEDAQENGSVIDTYIISHVSPEMSPESLRTFANRACMDFMIHSLLTQIIISHFISLLKSSNLEQLHQLSIVLLAEERLVDIIALHTCLSHVVAHCLKFLEEFDSEAAGDPQSTMISLGSLILFAQVLTHRYQLRSECFKVDGKAPSPIFLQTRPAPSRPLTLKRENHLFASWVSALFDRGSEGIEDHLLRATKPALLLQLAPALVSYAITALQARVIDPDALRSGLSYFQGTLLNWTLIGVINGLIAEITRLGLLAPLHFEALRCLLPSENIGSLRPVIQCCGPDLQRLLTDPRRDLMKARFKFDDHRIQHAVETIFPLINNSSHTSKVQWEELPRQAIRQAFAHAVDGGCVSLDITAGLLILEPINYLDTLWTEISAMASLGELSATREIGTFVLTALLPPRYPHLLPLFLTHTVPRYLSGLDNQRSLDVNCSTVLTNIIASSLLTAHYYKAFRGHGADPMPFNVADLMRTFLRRMAQMKSGVGDSLHRQIRLHS